MSHPLSDAVAASALELPIGDRAALAQKLWESLDDPPAVPADIEAEQIATARRRAEELKSGAVKGKTHKEVMENARREVG